MKKTDTHNSFIELCIKKEVLPDEIYRFIRIWHESDSTESLDDYLGMTFEEYAAWVEDSRNLVKIVEGKKYDIPLSDCL